jgi:hypothetical protein
MHHPVCLLNEDSKTFRAMEANLGSGGSGKTDLIVLELFCYSTLTSMAFGFTSAVF